MNNLEQEIKDWFQSTGQEICMEMGRVSREELFENAIDNLSFKSRQKFIKLTPIEQHDLMEKIFKFKYYSL
jgi:hypothetical protein